MILLQNSALAAPSGNITITGNVPVACDVVITPEAGATNIPDISAGDTDRLVATVTETCNDPDGYTVTVIGTNSGDHTGLFVDSISSDSLSFTISYDGVNVNPGGVVTDTVDTADGDSNQVDITYSSDSSLTGSVGASYQETLTFTISAK